MLKKQCPSCKASLLPRETVCACGYDFSMDDCPGCDQRIEEGLTSCPYCNYDLIRGVPAKVKSKSKDKKPTPVPVQVPVRSDDEEEPELKPIRRIPTGTRVCHVICLGHCGIPDSNYIELFWPQNQEINDLTLREWAQDFRDAYRDKCPGRKDQHLSNYAIYQWCKWSAVWHANRYDKQNRNDPLYENADRILSLLGGKDSGF